MVLVWNRGWERHQTIFLLFPRDGSLYLPLPDIEQFIVEYRKTSENVGRIWKMSVLLVQEARSAIKNLSWRRCDLVGWFVGWCPSKATSGVKVGSLDLWCTTPSSFCCSIKPTSLKVKCDTAMHLETESDSLKYCISWKCKKSLNSQKLQNIYSLSCLWVLIEFIYVSYES